MSMQAALAVTRFGLGASTGEIETASQDPVSWLSAQLTPNAIKDFPDGPLKPSKPQLAETMDYFRKVRGERANETDQRAFRRKVRETTVAEVTARTTFAASTDNPLHERLVRFWSNHFTVAANSPQTRVIAGAYEREAIRPHILGSFADLAEQAIFHAGMLVYLDNWQSIGPNSRAGRRSGRGLNENLAREVLELHTVTPEAGYRQDDVTRFAKALTGWTVGNHRVGQNRKGEATYSGLLHEPGRQTVLGKRYNDTGANQAKAILRDLCASPHTARHIAFKLARHFVSDVPPQTLVDKLTASFLETGGDLPALYAVLINADEAWAPQPMKFKTPDELIVSTGRLLGLRRVLLGDAGSLFESFAQIPFSAPSPEGWPDEAEAWSGPDAIMKRVEWANRLSERNAGLDARVLLERGLGERASDATVQAVMRAESPAQATALALLSPDFQMR